MKSSRIRIKFCGITRPADAEAAVALGVDALGFVAVRASARYVAPAKAAPIRRTLPPFVSAVALFKDSGAAEVLETIDALRPDLLQFHGEETPDFCASFGLPYMKAVAMGADVDLGKLARRYRSASALLLDSHAPGGMGGSGKPFDWRRVRDVSIPLVLAGGLTADNVAAAIRAAKPYAVDVSSGIESRPGVKDLRKMRAFVRAVRGMDSET